VTGLSYNWPGLTNGVRYKVRAQAVNELGPSDWGQYSAEDNPAGVPAAPAAPTSSVASSVGTSNQLKVDWNEPNTNGDAIRNYYVTMSGGGGAAQTQVVAGTVRTANFTANNSEASYTFTVQAENKAGKGAVSAASAPRRATGKLAQVTGVSATEADTGGAGRSVTINFRELTAAERNGSSSAEVSYTYRASTGQTGPIRPGQTVGGFTNGTSTSITVIANSAVAPSSDASAPATVNPYGWPGTPSASGTDGAENQKNLTLSWSSPPAGSWDIAYTQIRIDGGGWERVAASGSRTINTGGFRERHYIEVQGVNSRGTGGPLASASAQSGAQKTSWATRLNTGMDRSCTDLPGPTSYDPVAHTCDGKGGYDRPWMSHMDSFTVMCWKPHGTTYGGDGQWYYIMRGSPNATRWINSTHTSIGAPAQSGVPLCTFPTGATP
jgi:large repetitive protein